MSGIGKKVLGQIGEIGKDVVRETTKVPGDIAGAALESLGTSSGKKKKKGGTKGVSQKGQSKKAQGAWEQIDQETDEIKKARMARRAMLEFTTPKPKSKEKSVWERLQDEERAKKEQQLLAQAQARKNQLPEVQGKQKRGSAFAKHKKMRKKQTGMETKVNVKAG